MKLMNAVIVLASVSSLLFGCFTVQKGEHRTKTVDCGAVEQYAINKIDRVEFVPVPGSSNRFCLEAIGGFTVHSGRRQMSVDAGAPTMSVGIWPGYNCLQERDRGSYVACQSLLYWWNPIAWGATLWSTFVTPFSDNYRNFSQDQFLALSTIFGCVKYMDVDVSTYSLDSARPVFHEESVRKEDRVRLYNYRLEYDGGEYYDDNGVVKLVGKFSRGQIFRVKLVSAPALRPDSDERIEDLVGVCIESEPFP